MKYQSIKVYIVSYETAFGNIVEDFRTTNKAEADAAVDSYAEDGKKAFIDTIRETVYR